MSITEQKIKRLKVGQGTTIQGVDVSAYIAHDGGVKYQVHGDDRDYHSDTPWGSKIQIGEEIGRRRLVKKGIIR